MRAGSSHFIIITKLVQITTCSGMRIVKKSIEDCSHCGSLFCFVKFIVC